MHFFGTFVGEAVLFLCYVDESGYNGRKLNPKQPVQTMVGVFPNLYNYHRSDTEFRAVFEIVQQRIPMIELKATEIYGGRGSWKGLDPRLRDQVIEYYLEWAQERNHKFIVTAIDNQRFFETKTAGTYPLVMTHLTFPWLVTASQTACVVQKLNRTKSNNKGKTLLVFDEEDEFADQIAELLASPPEFVDEFVTFDAKKEHGRLNQIIDSAYFVKSHHSSMAQVVDIVSFVLRRHLELTQYSQDEYYDGETEKIDRWTRLVSGKFIECSKVYPNKRSEFLSLLRDTRARGLETI